MYRTRLLPQCSANVTERLPLPPPAPKLSFLLRRSVSRDQRTTSAMIGDVSAEGVACGGEAITVTA